MVASARTWHLGRVLALARRGASPASSAKPSDRTASSTHGRGSTCARSATGDSLRCASSRSTTKTAAFAYAEERMRASASRLAVTNRSLASLCTPWPTRDAVPTTSTRHSRRFSDRFVYDDRRRLSGDPIRGAGRIASRRRANPRSSTAALSGALWPCEVSASLCLGAAGPMMPGTRRPTCTCSRSAMTGGSSMKAASTRTTSKAPTASSNGATTPARARRSPKRVPLATDFAIAVNQRRLRPGVRRPQPPRHAPREPVAIGLSGSLGSRVSRQPRGAERDGRFGADVALGRAAGCRRTGSSPALTRDAVGHDGEQYAMDAARS